MILHFNENMFILKKYQSALLFPSAQRARCQLGASSEQILACSPSGKSADGPTLVNIQNYLSPLIASLHVCNPNSFAQISVSEGALCQQNHVIKGQFHACLDLFINENVALPSENWHYAGLLKILEQIWCAEHIAVAGQRYCRYGQFLCALKRTTYLAGIVGSDAVRMRMSRHRILPLNI
jgi:hypothetical protein